MLEEPTEFSACQVVLPVFTQIFLVAQYVVLDGDTLTVWKSL
ncbi:hypothetical protein [Cryobacterium psychrophilum]|nr:hypothetical protein [Cryobacterium psychrophilum]